MDLYGKMLNLREQDNLSIIEDIISKNRREVQYYTKDFSALCKIISNNISVDLYDKSIKNIVVNTRDLIDSYQHEFVIANFFDKEMKYVLIDLTYIQFLKNERESLIAFDKWPSDVLKTTKDGLIMLNDLLDKGYIFIDDKLLNTYLSSFNEKNNDITIEYIYEEKRGMKR